MVTLIKRSVCGPQALVVTLEALAPWASEDRGRLSTVPPVPELWVWGILKGLWALSVEEGSGSYTVKVCGGFASTGAVLIFGSQHGHKQL